MRKFCGINCSYALFQTLLADAKKPQKDVHVSIEDGVLGSPL